MAGRQNGRMAGLEWQNGGIAGRRSQGCQFFLFAILPSCNSPFQPSHSRNFVAAVWAIVLVATMIAGCGSGTVAPSSGLTVPAPSSPSGPPPPNNGAAISVPSTGFSIRDVHILQGFRLTFVNGDIEPHDIMSDPFHVHTDCPEINVVGFLTPGQSRTSDPLNTIRTCGFHDHDHEGDERFHGTVSVEAP